VWIGFNELRKCFNGGVFEHDDDPFLKHPHKLRVFGVMFLWIILRLTGEEVTVDWRNFHNENSDNFYSSYCKGDQIHDIMCGSCSTHGIGDNVYNIVVGNLEAWGYKVLMGK
jgi:hypothetical protein